MGAGSVLALGRARSVMTETRTFIDELVGRRSGDVFLLELRNPIPEGQAGVEHLGTQTIEGVSAEGTRTTVTIPAGQIGNEQPIVTTTERWYSPELQVTVMNKRQRSAHRHHHLQADQHQSQRAFAAMFQVPADYTISNRHVRG